MTTARLDSAGRGRRWQHAFFYIWLVVASAGPLADRFAAGQGLVPALVLIAVLAAWYALWMRRGTARIRWATTIYLAGAGAVWLALLLVDGSFAMLGLTMFVPHCLESRRIGLTVVALAAGAWLWQRYAATGSVAWPEIVIALLIGLGGTATVGYVSSQVRISAERKRLLDEVQAAQAGRAAAERRAGVADERQRLARDIHDTITQGFASIVMLLEAAEETLPEAEPARRHVTLALRTARESMTESRRAVWALRSGQLADSGLPEALRQVADRVAEETGLRVTARVTGTPVELPEEPQTALLRVAGEALANVRRHAQARRATLTLSYMDDVVVLDVRDDGIGVEAGRNGSASEGGVGLAAMRERLDAVGGSLLVETAPGQGTTIVATVPIPPVPAAPTPVTETTGPAAEAQR